MVLGELLAIIAIIQIALHTPLLNVKVTSNVLSFYSKVFPIVNYDFLAGIESYNNFLEYVSRLSNSKEKLTESFDSGIAK